MDRKGSLVLPPGGGIFVDSLRESKIPPPLHTYIKVYSAYYAVFLYEGTVTIGDTVGQRRWYWLYTEFRPV